MLRNFIRQSCPWTQHINSNQNKNKNTISLTLKDFNYYYDNQIHNNKYYEHNYRENRKYGKEKRLKSIQEFYIKNDFDSKDSHHKIFINNFSNK